MFRAVSGLSPTFDSWLGLAKANDFQAKAVCPRFSKARGKGQYLFSLALRLYFFCICRLCWTLKKLFPISLSSQSCCFWFELSLGEKSNLIQKTAGRALGNKRKLIPWKTRFYSLITTLWGENVRAEIVQLEEGSGCNPIPMCNKYFTRGSKEGDRGFSEVSSDGVRGNWHKLKYSELHLNTGKPQWGHGITMPGNIHNPNGAEQIALGVTAWAEGWTSPPQLPPSLSHSVVLPQLVTYKWPWKVKQHEREHDSLFTLDHLCRRPGWKSGIDKTCHWIINTG